MHIRNENTCSQNFLTKDNIKYGECTLEKKKIYVHVVYCTTETKHFQATESEFWCTTEMKSLQIESFMI